MRGARDIVAAMKDEQGKYLDSLGAEVERIEGGKIRFVVSGMEFPSTAPVEQLRTYYEGRAMRRARVERANEEYDFEQHLPNIVPHKKHEKKFLYCHLTRSVLPRDASKVSAHVAGRRFKARLAVAQARNAERKRIADKRAERRAAARKWALANGEDPLRKKTEGDALLDGEYQSADDSDFDPDSAGVGAPDVDGSDEEFEKESEDVFDVLAKAAQEGDTLATALMDGGEESSGEAPRDADVQMQEQNGATNGASVKGANGKPSKKKKSRKAKKKAEEKINELSNGDVDLAAPKETKKEEDESFWTRGKHDDLVQIDADVMDDGTDDEWAAPKRKKGKGKRAVQIVLPASGAKRKHAPTLPKKSRQQRLKRVTGGAVVKKSMPVNGASASN